MKKIIFIFPAILVFSNGFSQINPTEDYLHVKPQKGLIKKEITTIEDSTGKIPYISEISYYNEDGYETNSFRLNHASDTLKHIYTYYLGNGRELTVYTEKSRLDSAYENYNEKNYLVNDLWLMGTQDPSDKDSTIYSYDSNGNLIKLDEKYWKNVEVYNYKDNKIISIITTDSDVDTEAGEKPEEYVSAEYKYLDDGKKIESMDYIGKNKPYSKTIENLNHANMPILVEVFKYPSKKKHHLAYKKVLTYHENGTLKTVHINWFENEDLKWTLVDSYNEKGQLVESINTNDITGAKSINQYKYYYK